MEQMSRTQAREKAYEIIFMIELCDSIDCELDILSEELKDHKKHMKYVSSVVKAVSDNLEEIDGIISENLDKSWSLNRLSKMSIAVLRLAVAEIKYLGDIPAAVSINEAVELSKKYGDEGEPSFVNGILSKIVK